MSMPIRDAYHLPAPEDIRALEFVVRLRDGDASAPEAKRLVDDYVITPAVRKELPLILDAMKQVFDRGEEYGRFVHGSFGSGKSHFLTMLAMLLENGSPAWQKFGAIVNAHGESQQAKGRDPVDHAGWLAKANLLVVRIHMLSVRGRNTSFDRAMYEGFNQALKQRGKAPFEFLNLDAIFNEVRRDASVYGDVLWKDLETAGLVGSAADFEAIASGTERVRENFARHWLEHKGRNAADAGIDPRWSEGLRRMAEHAKAQGFGGLVLMIDEFLLWLAEKSGEEFAREINSLNLIVDHSTGQRAAPVFVFVARQRNLQEFFPDLVDESKIHEHLDHHSHRFEETRLQDVELRHIVRERVLRPRDGAAVEAAVAALAEKHQRVLPALGAGADLDYLRDVYPFHPALIEMLVDVTSLMQRERSALRLLYELLVVHYPTLPLGEFLPVGSAFDAIFPEAGVEASKKVDLMQDIHHQYHMRLAPTMRRMAEEAPDELNGERLRALDQMVKTVLLAEVSPRLKQGGLTIERLVQLNAVDVEGETFRGQVRVAETDLQALSQRVPDLQVAGTGRTAIVRYVLGRVSLGEILNRARSKVDNQTQRFKVFWAALKSALGLQGARGFEEGGPNDGEYDLQWRKTRRRGRVKLGNIRELPYEAFEAPSGAFKILVDYPWDEPGHSVDEDRLRANKVKSRHTQHTICWLPRHFTPRESDVLTEVAAVRYLQSEPGQEDLLTTLGQQDRNTVLDQARIREENLQGQLAELLREVYVRHGEVHALVSDIDGSRPRETLAENLVHLATVLMDRRYPSHPHFEAEPNKAGLELLLEWMVAAGESHLSVAYDEATGRALRTLGRPLELVNLGQTKATLRLDSRYIKDVLQKTDHESVAWTPVAEHLRDTYGLQPPIIELFLCFLCRRDHRALNDATGDPVEVKIGMPATVSVRLQRGTLLGAAEWARLRDLGYHLFGLPRPPANRSLQAQDRFAEQLRKEGSSKRQTIQALHERVMHLGAEKGRRLDELAQANERLAPLAQSTTESHKVLSALLALWPDDTADPVRTVVFQAAQTRDALTEVTDSLLDNLRAGASNAVVGPEVQAHLATFIERLEAAHAAQPITREWVRDFVTVGQKLVQRLIEVPKVAPIAPATPATPSTAPPDTTPAVVTPPNVTPPEGHAPAAVLLTQKVKTGDADELGAFVGALRAALQKQGGTLKVTVTTEEVGA